MFWPISKKNEEKNCHNQAKNSEKTKSERDINESESRRYR